MFLRITGRYENSMLSGVEYNRRESVDQIESAESEVGLRDYAYASRITSKASIVRLGN